MMCATLDSVAPGALRAIERRIRLAPISTLAPAPCNRASLCRRFGRCNADRQRDVFELAATDGDRLAAH